MNRITLFAFAACWPLLLIVSPAAAQDPRPPILDSQKRQVAAIDAECAPRLAKLTAKIRELESHKPAGSEPDRFASNVKPTTDAENAAWKQYSAARSKLRLEVAAIEDRRREKLWALYNAEQRSFVSLRALESPTWLEFVETPVKDALDYLRDVHQIKIIVDESAAPLVADIEKCEITLNIKGITLDSGLRLMLAGHGLVPILRDGIIVIATKEAAKKYIAQGAVDPAPLVAPKKAKRLERIRLALLRPTTFNCTAMPLDDVLDSLQNGRETLFVDPWRLRAGGDAKIDIDAKSLPMRSALADALAQAGRTFVIRDEAIVIVDAKAEPAIAAVVKLGGIVSMTREDPDEPALEVNASLAPDLPKMLAALADLTDLKALYLENCGLKDAALPPLARLTGLEKLSLSGNPITDAGLANLKGLKGLKSLWLDGTQISDAGLTQIEGLTNLETLMLADTKITDAAMPAIVGLPHLKALSLEDTKITDAALKQIKQLRNLRHLRLTFDNLTDAGLAQLAGLTDLETLDFGNPPDSHIAITGAGLRHIRGLTGLRRLRVANVAVMSADLENLAGLKQLEALSLDGINDDGLRHLAGLTNLRSLDLLNVPDVTDAGIEQLRTLTKLESLMLNGAKLTDAGIGRLQTLTKLESLCLFNSKVTDGVAVQLKAFPNLRSLELGGCSLGDRGLERLQALKPLERLDLSQTAVTNAGLAYLRGLPRLEYLDLHETAVSDAGVESLSKLSGLNDLLVWRTKVTAAGAAKLRKALPHCDVHSD